MSMTADGKVFLCDGEECNATAELPVTLNPVSLSDARNIEGWLFVFRYRSAKHFCPLCALAHLEQASADE